MKVWKRKTYEVGQALFYIKTCHKTTVRICKVKNTTLIILKQIQVYMET